MDRHNSSDKMKSPSGLNDLQGFHQNSQNRVQTIDELVPLGNCSWVDLAEQVEFTLIFWAALEKRKKLSHFQSVSEQKFKNQH